MKHVLKKSLLLYGVLSALIFSGTTSAKVFIRSQSEDSARELVGWTNHINLFNVDRNYGTFAITPEYTESFKDARIARCLFGSALGNSCDDSSDCAFFKVSGSRVNNRGTNDLLADYFGLPTDFESIVSVSPKIKNFLIDFNLYLGLDEFLCGLWFRIHAPVVWARWNLNYNEKVTVAGANGYDEGYFASTAIARSSLLNSFHDYLSGNVPDLGDTVVFQPLAHDLVCNGTTSTNVNNCLNSCGCSLNKTKLSDIQMALGWNFWQDEDYHVGLGIRAHVPTGTRITSACLFEPQIGNGHHWELGGMFTSHYTFWRNCDNTKSMGLYVDLNVTHEFAATQCRTFDLCGRGDNSKYMLLEMLGTPVNNHLEGRASQTTGSFTSAVLQFKNIFAPAANIAFAQVQVSIPVQADLSVMFNYTHCDMSYDLGYNLWATSCERIKTCGNNSLIAENKWALKGDAHVYGFDNATVPTGPVALSATQTGTTCDTSANIHTGRNFDGTNSVAVAITNPNIDNVLYAFGDGAGTTANNRLYATSTSTSAANQIRTSIQPITLTSTDIDFDGARSKGLTHKIFAHISRTWSDCECLVPYLGIGGKFEVSPSNDGHCASLCEPVSCSLTNCSNSLNGTNCTSGCSRCSISEWGVWVKGGVSF